jgi:hypothetical protein
MPIELIVALIGAIAVLIAAILRFITDMRKERIEKDKVQVEREKIYSGKDQFISNQQEKTEQTNVLNSEEKKCHVDKESQKILSDIRQVDYLMEVFEQSFITSTSYHDPLDIYKTIRRTRILLEERGTFLFNDNNLEDNFHHIKELIREIDLQVRNRCPQIVDLVIEIENQTISAENLRLKRLSELSNRMNCSEVIKFIIEKHGKILGIIQKIQNRAHELSD